MTPRDLARLYLDKGRDDELVAERLAPMADVPDSGVGFHAQQAIEKYLKAVLALNEVRVQKTHEIGALLGQVAELGLDLPDGVGLALELNPYSVLERYPLAPESEPLDRATVLDLVARMRAWCAELVEEG